MSSIPCPLCGSTGATVRAIDPHAPCCEDGALTAEEFTAAHVQQPEIHRAACCGETYIGSMDAFYASHDCPNAPVPQLNTYADANGFCPIDANPEGF